VRLSVRPGSQVVDVRGLVERAAVASHVLPAHVVDQDEDEVQLRLSSILRQCALGRNRCEDGNAEKDSREPVKQAHG
jgi:hypothetical protein